MPWIQYLYHRCGWFPTDHQGFFLDLGELLLSANPDEFCFWGIQFQSIWAHPRFDFRYTGQQMSGSGLKIPCGATDADLGVVGIYMDLNSKSQGNSDNVSRVENEQEGPEDQTLWHTTQYTVLCGCLVSIEHCLGSSCYERDEPPKCMPRIPYDISNRLIRMSWSTMWLFVESSIHVEHAKQSNLLTIGSADHFRDFFFLNIFQDCIQPFGHALLSEPAWHYAHSVSPPAR